MTAIAVTAFAAVEDVVVVDDAHAEARICLSSWIDCPAGKKSALRTAWFARPGGPHAAFKAAIATSKQARGTRASEQATEHSGEEREEWD